MTSLVFNREGRDGRGVLEQLCEKRNIPEVVMEFYIYEVEDKKKNIALRKKVKNGIYSK